MNRLQDDSFRLCNGRRDSPHRPNQILQALYQQQMVVLAEQELNLQFENRNMPDVIFPSGYTTNVYLGVFIWSSADMPSNHSPLSFSEVEPIRMDEQKNHHLLLQLVLTQCKGMTVDEIKASNKQEVKAPTSVHGMIVQLCISYCQSPLPGGRCPDLR